MARSDALDPAQVSLRLQSSGPLRAEELAKALGVSRVTVQRVLRRLGPQVLKLGVTRSTRYALARFIQGRAGAHRIYRFGASGKMAHEWARLTALHGGWRLEWASEGLKPEWADRVHDHAGFCEGLPFFLSDARPQGYLGRAVARGLPESLGWPLDPRNWSDDHTLGYLVAYGEDVPGNLVVGDLAMSRAGRDRLGEAVALAERASAYPALAAQANAGTPAGSSVEGEQPKFTAWLRDESGEGVEAVIVKFTDRLDTPTGRRWADLLVAEQTALDLMRSPAAGAEAAGAEILDFAERRYFQVSRFDRLGSQGRRGLVSLRALHDAGFCGVAGEDWVEAAEGLHANGWIGARDLTAVRLRQAFGRLIGNTDMHFGNLAFYLEDTLPLRVAPLYDMLPMLWAPKPGQAEPAPEFTPAAPVPHEIETWASAAELADQFWARVEGDARVSDGFRPHAAAAGRAVRALRARFG
jgi:hypothetical protein